jgi:hypothetical protein
MPLTMELWRIDGESAIRLEPTGMPLESQLEGLIDKDPALLGQELLIVGRQVATSFGKFIDLLAVDDEGVMHVLELKRDKTPREVVAQLLDYGSWVRSMSNTTIREVYSEHHPGSKFDQAFENRFGTEPPAEINTSHMLTVVASSLDASTERIITYLHEVHHMPINTVFFRYYEDHGQKYLGRTWLIPESIEVAAPGAAKQVTEPWDGTSWYVNFGVFPDQRVWEDGRKYGFVAAGGVARTSRPLTKLPVDARVFVYLTGESKKHGYVGVGIVTGIARPAAEAVLDVDGKSVPFNELLLEGVYIHPASDDPREFIVPVRWERAVPAENAVWQAGLFSHPRTACKLRSKFTIDAVLEGFHLTE